MRIDVKKMLFVGRESDRLLFFSKAQKQGIIQFIDSHARKHKETPEEVQDLIQAIKIVRSLVPLEQEETDRLWRSSVITSSILDLRKKIDFLEEDLRMTKLEITRVEIFGDFSRKRLTYLEQEGKRHIQFYCSRKGTFDDLRETPELLYVGTDAGLDYFVAVNKERKQFPGMIEMQIDEPLGELQKKRNEIIKELHESEEQLKGFAKYNELLHQALAVALNKHQLHFAETGVDKKLDERIFAVEGWVPVNKEKELQQLIQETGVLGEQVLVEENDPMPTCLENEGMARIGEDLVHIYDTPAPTDKDPSLWVLWFFAIFFAMIVGDGGYGMIYLALGIFLYYKFPNWKGALLRFRKLVFILATACIAWGFLSNSFFGIKFMIDSPIRYVSLVDWLDTKKADYHLSQKDKTYQDWLKEFPAVADAESGREMLQNGATFENGEWNYVILDSFSDNVLIELALLIGLIHVTLSFLRYIRRNLAGIGWILFMWGAYLYLPTYLGVVSMANYLLGIPPSFGETYGIEMMNWGLILAVSISLIQNRLMGILEITNVIQVFADILSYLRLYALGLASAILTATVNEMAASLAFGGGLVLILGHMINMVLGIMGGVIHGLRLNFLEWYHYSFDGDGKPFKPLKILEMD